MPEKVCKTYVLDTNVLIQSPYAMFAFDEHTVVIPDVVIEELDSIKVRQGDEGANAREVIRILEELRTSGKGSLTKGVQLPAGGNLYIETDAREGVDIEGSWNRDKADYKVLAVAKGLAIRPNSNIILVTNDMSLRVKADLCGVVSEGYRSESVEQETAYTGRRELCLSQEELDRLYQEKSLQLTSEAVESFETNEFVTVRAGGGTSSALARYIGNGELRLIRQMGSVYGIKPKNAGQRFAMDALLAPASEIPLCILQGGAGTAKTFLSLACGLEQVLGAEPSYRRILVARPNVKFDETVGYLKGTEEDKIGPLIRPIMDNLDQLTAVKVDERDRPIARKGKRNGQDFDDKGIVAPNSYAQDLFDSGKLVAQAMEYMRGRSITDTYIIIDEAQGVTPLQAFGIISRAGYGAKIVLVGDPDQIDNPQLDKRTNGLSYAAACMKGSKLCAQLYFSEDECVRSPLAKEAIKRMGTKGEKRKGAGL